MQRRTLLQAAAGLAVLLPARSLLAKVAAGDGELAAKTLAGDATSLQVADIEDLAASLRGHIVLPGQAGFDEARRVWNGMIDRRPALIVRCAAPTDVMKAVDFAREHRLLTAVRGGGHSGSGKSVCDGGLVI